MPAPTLGSPVSLVTLTGNNSIDSMLWGTKWGGAAGTGAALTYSFPGVSAVWSTDPSVGYGANTGGGEPWSASYAPLWQASEQAAFTDALSTWSNVANVSFTQVADGLADVGDIRVAYTDTPNAAAWAYGPYNAPAGGDVWVDSAYSMTTAVRGNYAFHTLVHELGHTLGLKHSFAANQFSPDVLPQSMDSLWNTVMSYTDWYGTVWNGGSPMATSVSGFLSYYPTTPMSLDIEAMQYLYGPNQSHNAGNSTYVYSQWSSYFETIWDAGGIDTIQYNAITAGGVIDLRPGAWSKLGNSIDVYDASGNFVATESKTVNIYKTVVIENATGSNLADSLWGNDVANVLIGNGGNDQIGGGAGNDILSGGAGNDILSGGAGIDWAYYNAATSGVVVNLGLVSAQNTIGGGVDTLIDVESLLGSGYNDTLLGSSIANNLYGMAGNDVLDGLAGADNLVGGAGNDLYIVDNAGDLVVEVSSTVTEIDSVRSSVSYGLSANVENLALAGAAAINATGNGLNNTLTGNAAANVLDGGAGNDILIGGLGNDTLIGGGGIDWAYYNSATAGVYVQLSVAVRQNTIGAGLDTLSGIEYLLGSNYNDTLAGSAANNMLNGGGGNDRLYGVAGNDTLYGGAGNDTLIGGVGKDCLVGGAGNDIFYFSATAESSCGINRDVITDFVRGTDRVNLFSIDARAATAGVNDAFGFVSGGFTGAGQVKFANGILYGNTDGNLSTAEFEIAFTGVASLTASDFIL